MTELEQRARELLSGIRNMAMDTIDKLLCSTEARESVRQSTNARFDVLQTELSSALTAAFNLGAGGAYEDAAQFCEGQEALDEFMKVDLPIEDWLAKKLRQRTPADAVAVVERKVSETRLEEHQKLCSFCLLSDRAAWCDRGRQLEAEAAAKGGG